MEARHEPTTLAANDRKPNVLWERRKQFALSSRNHDFGGGPYNSAQYFLKVVLKNVFSHWSRMETRRAL
jgi:hypothetical protein